MHAARTLPPVDRFWPCDTGRTRVLRALLLVLTGTLILTASAKIQVPFWPVPMTLQTAALFLIALAYGRKLALATVALYLLEGIYGLPVFAGTPERGLGLAYLLGPTGGYLVGFLLAAGIAGWAAERRMSTVALLLALLVATAAIYLPGVAWLARFVGLEDAIAFGAAPFLLGDLVKLLLVLAVARVAFAPPAGSAVDRSA